MFLGGKKINRFPEKHVTAFLEQLTRFLEQLTGFPEQLIGILKRKSDRLFLNRAADMFLE